MPTQKTLYYLPTYGQLGNQLATLAHLLSFAVEYGYVVIYPASDYFSKHIQLFQLNQNRIVFNRRLSQPKIAYGIIKAVKLLFLNRNAKAFGYLVLNQKFVVEKDFNHAAQPDVIIVTDWLFRYYTGVKKHQDLLRKELSFTHLSVGVAVQKWQVLQATYPQHTFIGVHVRRGDYAEWLGGKYFYDDATYYRWMSQLCGLVNQPIFIVCSNENLQFDNNADLKIIYAKGSPSEDLFLLSCCDYIIGPPSTFSSWSAFLGDRLLYQPETQDETMKLNLFGKYYL